MIAYQIMVDGRVQGVGFRYFVFELAKKYNISGWVKNLKDGSVLIQVVGNQDSMELFLAESQEGSGASIVLNFKTQEISVFEADGFMIFR